MVGPGRGKYSIADISLVGWVNSSSNIPIDLAAKFPNIKTWFDRIYARPAVQRGFAVPKQPASAIFLEPTEEARAKRVDRTKIIQEAKDKYNWKYSSP